jgi:hypothetical protein
MGGVVAISYTRERGRRIGYGIGRLDLREWGWSTAELARSITVISIVGIGDARNWPRNTRF